STVTTLRNVMCQRFRLCRATPRNYPSHAIAPSEDKMEQWTRRRFFLSGLAGTVAATAANTLGAALPTDVAAPARPNGQTAKQPRSIIISAHNGLRHLDAGMQVLQSGGDTLDAVLAVVVPVELDPHDSSVGYGGLPNEEGVVQLDACVMHGPTRRCGAVAAIEKIKTPSKVARVVMERTNHTFIVGEGATKFAIEEGFEPADLLTPQSRTAWL